MDDVVRARFELLGTVVPVIMAGLLVVMTLPANAAVTPRTVVKSSNLARWNLPSRSIGVGGAYAADADGLQGGITNPASLSRLQTHQFSVEHQSWREQWKLFNTGVAVPMYGGHSLSFNATWLDYGELEPEPDTQLFRPQGNEFKGGVSYSYRLTENSSYGINAGLMSSEIGFLNRKYEPYVDLGYIQRLPNNIWIGATVKNLVGDLTVEDGQDKLPLQSRLGVAWYLLQDRIALTGDAIYHDPGSAGDEDKGIGAAGGARLLLFDHYRFSAGYHNYYDGLSGMTGGLQIEYPNFKWKFSFMDTGRDNLVRLGGNMRF